MLAGSAVAAEAGRTGQRTFYDRLKRREAGEESFARLLEDLRQAKAEARAGAEQKARARDPATWLTKGPGRERPGEPVWTSASRSTVH